MSSNRLSYDTCAYQKSLEISTGPLEYSMYTGKYENCAKCRIEFGVVGGNGVSLFSGNLVDLESDLRGQTRLASLCPNTMYNPEAKNNPRNLVNQPSCQMQYYPKTPVPELPGVSGCDYKNINRANVIESFTGKMHGEEHQYKNNHKKHHS
jgi:hypothetical protein